LAGPREAEAKRGRADDQGVPGVRLVQIACCAVAYIVCSIASAFAQTPSTLQPHHSMDTVDQLPPERLPPPPALQGVGNLHVPITASPEAQRWFDQGINLYHDFWDYEAARAFEQSVRVDPNCAMCYWGLYKAESFYHSNSPGYAGPALAKAVSL